MTSAATLRLSDLSELDTSASIIEAAAKRVRSVVLHGGLFAVGGTTCFYLHRAQRRGEKLRIQISAANVKSPADRALMRDIASNLGQAARALDQAFEQSEKRGLASKVPVFGPILMRKLEDLVCALEDMAETASLGASEGWARTVRNDIRDNVRPSSHHRRRATA